MTKVPDKRYECEKCHNSTFCLWEPILDFGEIEGKGFEGRKSDLYPYLECKVCGEKVDLGRRYWD